MTFDVSATTLDEARAKADRELRKIAGPEMVWDVELSVVPGIRTASSDSPLSWTVEIEATGRTK